MYKNEVYVPNSEELRNLTMKQMNNIPHVGYPIYYKIILVMESS